MKGISGIVCALLVCILSLSGCAGKDENYNAWLTAAQKTHTDGKEQVIKYLEKGQAVDTEVLKGLAAKGNDTAIVLYGLITKDRDAAILNEFKVEVPKAPTTQNDVLNTVAKETVPTLTRWGFGYLGVKELSGVLAGAGGTTNNINAKDNATVNLEQNKVNAGRDGALNTGGSSTTQGGDQTGGDKANGDQNKGNSDSGNTTTNSETPPPASEEDGDVILVE